ncbi:deoxynucleoside kinase [Pseudothermotoga thermarum]|uniref:Deoxynucleoside kinase n=1 Tax=Pseudothermotoga thermarum DSM 5069 TaxID=688269 RepID=F7YWQ9_9THEM|nr:deoxynucleoside kinase [Pseudothermotoga thermarum]AEH52049.1 deoxynucleoside kinase [Pseudothermotoga thermarum DSM 5069]
MKPKVIVEGTVGAGKTTFIEVMSKKLNLEPIYELSDQKLVEILEKFYADPAKWGFQLQIYFLTKRFEQMDLAKKKVDVIMDRSIFCDHIFPLTLLKCGKLTNLEYEIYKDLHTTLLKLATAPRLMVYLRCSTETAIKRIEKRGRSWELKVDKNYWYVLNQCYEEYFANYNLSSLLVVNTDNIDEKFEGLDDLIKELLKSKRKVICEYDGKSVKRSVRNAGDSR